MNGYAQGKRPDYFTGDWQAGWWWWLAVGWQKREMVLNLPGKLNLVLMYDIKLSILLEKGVSEEDYGF